jgi:hypothetical protein
MEIERRLDAIHEAADRGHTDLERIERRGLETHRTHDDGRARVCPRIGH